MFGIGKKQWTNSNNLVGTIIGKDTYFRGSINSQEIIRIDGNFEGDITTTNDLVVSETGHVKGPLKSRNATVSGLIEGTVDVSEKLELLSTVKLYGDIRASSLSVTEGAVLQGSCFMQHSIDSQPKAVPDANNTNDSNGSNDSNDSNDSTRQNSEPKLVSEKKVNDNLPHKKKASIVQKV